MRRIRSLTRTKAPAKAEIMIIVASPPRTGGIDGEDTRTIILPFGPEGVIIDLTAKKGA